MAPPGGGLQTVNIWLDSCEKETDQFTSESCFLRKTETFQNAHVKTFGRCNKKKLLFIHESIHDLTKSNQVNDWTITVTSYTTQLIIDLHHLTTTTVSEEEHSLLWCSLGSTQRPAGSPECVHQRVPPTACYERSRPPLQSPPPHTSRVLIGRSAGDRTQSRSSAPPGGTAAGGRGSTRWGTAWPPSGPPPRFLVEGTWTLLTAAAAQWSSMMLLWPQGALHHRDNSWLNISHSYSVSRPNLPHPHQGCPSFFIKMQCLEFSLSVERIWPKWSLMEYNKWYTKWV